MEKRQPKAVRLQPNMIHSHPPFFCRSGLSIGYALRRAAWTRAASTCRGDRAQAYSHGMLLLRLLSLDVLVLGVVVVGSTIFIIPLSSVVIGRALNAKCNAASSKPDAR